MSLDGQARAGCMSDDHALDHGVGVVGGRREQLAGGEVAVGRQQRDVGESAADIRSNAMAARAGGVVQVQS